MPICMARVFIRFEKLFALPEIETAAAFAASFPETIIMPLARSLSLSFSPTSRYIELPSAIILSVKVITRSFLAASSSVSRVVISFVVLAGFMRLLSFFERIIFLFSTQ